MKKTIVLLIGIFLLSALALSSSACKKEQKKSYTATLDVNGGELLEQSVFSFDVGDFFVFETPERTGYTFLGWYDGDEKLKGTVWKFTEDKTFVAKWQINQYLFRVDYKKNAGSVSGTEAGSYDYGTEISVTASQPNLGYFFIGWYLGETKVSEESNYVFSLGASDTVLTANYTVREEMQVFDFTSSLTECAVMGIKDQTVTEILLPEYVTSVADGAFSGCSQVEKMTIPFVGKRAGVTASDTYQYPFGYIFGTSSYTGGTKTEQYYHGSSTSNTTYDTYYIPSSLKSVMVTGGNILYGAFSNCGVLTSVTIGNMVTSIEERAFAGCIGMMSVTIGKSVTSIGDDAFFGCGLDNITVSEGNPMYYSQGNCLIETASKYLILGSNNSVIPVDGTVIDIGYFAFRNCKGLTSVTIPDSVTSIGDGAFQNCSGLTSVTIGNGVTSIGSYAFEDCSGLTSVTIGNGVTSIENSAFSGCSSLTSVTIGNGVTSIEYDAFYNCSGLTSVSIPDSVTSIGNCAFGQCYKLVEVINQAPYPSRKVQAITDSLPITL